MDRLEVPLGKSLYHYVTVRPEGNCFEFKYTRPCAFIRGDDLCSIYAGYLMRDLYGYEIVARPLGIRPDLIMSKGEDTLGLAEVTTSATFTGLGYNIGSKAIDMIDLVAHFRYLSDKKLKPYIVGTAFTDRHDFEAFILELLMP